MKCMQFCAVRSFTRSMPSIRLLYILPALLLLAMAPAQAQLTTAEEKGLPPDSVFHLGDIDAINLQNGNNHIFIPIASEKQRGGLTLSWGLVYDTPIWLKQWNPSPCPGNQPQDIIVYPDRPPEEPLPPCPKTGNFDVYETAQATTNWRFTSPAQWTAEGTPHTGNCPVPVEQGAASGDPNDISDTYYLYTYYTNWMLYDYQGTAHPVPLRTENYSPPELPIGASTFCLGSTTQGPALDGSGAYLSLAAGRYDSLDSTGYTKDGVQMLQATYQLQDANGNLVNATADTLGRNDVVVSYDPNYPVPTSAGSSTHEIYTVHDSNGNAQQYLVDFEPVNFTSNGCNQTGFGGTTSGIGQNTDGMACAEVSEPILELVSITLPDKKAYVFTYNAGSPGELARIDLPTGGSISYTYQDFYQVSYSTGKAMPNNVVGGRAVASRTVTVDGRSYVWTYNPTLLADAVTDPEGNVQVHSFSPISIVVGNTSYQSTGEYEVGVSYQDAKGDVLRTTQTDYAADFAPVDQSVANVRPIRTDLPPKSVRLVLRIYPIAGAVAKWETPAAFSKQAKPASFP
jgi:hypothetical protein